MKLLTLSVAMFSSLAAGSLYAAEKSVPVNPEQMATTDLALTADETLVDVFASETALNEDVLRTQAGGTGTVIDVGNVGVNVSTTTGTVENNSADGSVTGTISDNVIGQNSGFTTVFINSGNNVLFQNTLQVNIFAGSE